MEGLGTGRLPRGIGGRRDGDVGAMEGREVDSCASWEVDSDLLTTEAFNRSGSRNDVE